MWNTSSLPLLLGPLLLGMIIPVRVSSVGQIELLNHLTVCKQMIELSVLHRNIAWSAGAVEYTGVTSAEW